MFFYSVRAVPATALVLALTTGSIAMRAAESSTNLSRVQIPVEFRQGSLLVPLRIKDAKLSFKLDTGFGVNTLQPDLVEKLELKQTGSITIIGIAGEEEAARYSGVTLDFGGLTYSPRYLVVMPSDMRRRVRTRDGILGAGFFRRFVVEI